MCAKDGQHSYAKLNSAESRYSVPVYVFLYSPLWRTREETKTKTVWLQRNLFVVARLGLEVSVGTHFLLHLQFFSLGLHTSLFSIRSRWTKEQKNKSSAFLYGSQTFQRLFFFLKRHWFSSVLFRLVVMHQILCATAVQNSPEKRVCESSVAWAGAFCKPAAGSREACSPSASSWRSKHSRPRYKQMPPRPSVEKSSLKMNFSFYYIKHKTTDKMLETIVYIIFVFSYRLRCQDLKKQLHPPNLTPPLTSLL